MSDLVIESQQTRLLNVLLVEDNVIDARLVSGLLKGPSGMLQCRHVACISEALQLLKTIDFDVILLDLNLEDSSGYETFSTILPSAGKAALLVLSSSDDEELATRTVREGAQDYLVKGSFDGRLLLRSIRYAFERKRSEEALRESEAAVRAIFENSLEGIIITDDHGACIQANSAAATLTGLPHQKLIGSSFQDLAEGEFEAEWRRFRSERNARARIWIQRADRSRRLVDCGFSAEILPGNHLLILRDITDQQNLEEQLRQSQKMEAVGRLAGGVAHDFNNILGIISGYAELLQLNATESSQKTKAEKILAAIGKAASLTKQLLAFGRRQVMSPVLLDLSTAISGVSSMVYCLAGAEIQVNIHCQEKLGVINADQGLIEQVILNLATNARDAMPNGGVLNIRVEDYTSSGADPQLPAGEYVLLSVQDTGAGMDPETQSRIFEPFFTTKKKGSGLGLSTVYGIVKQSGGYILVHSEPGAGSTFNVYLPRVAKSQGVIGHQEQKGRVDPIGNETILLVDDEDDLRNATGEYLAGCGYRVLKAKDGREAIEIADTFPDKIAVLISDVVMPSINGRLLVEHVKKTRPQTNILLVSGYTDDAVIRRGLFFDKGGFLQKPYSFQVLGSKIRTLLDRSQ